MSSVLLGWKGRREEIEQQRLTPTLGLAEQELAVQRPALSSSNAHWAQEVQPEDTRRMHESGATTSEKGPFSRQSIWRGALSLFEKSNPHKGIARFGLPFLQTIKHYVFSDPFTTLLDAPRGRFIMVFFSLYMATYFFFAILYMIFPAHCMNEKSRNFGHAFWFSFQTASTIGYSSGMFPDPDCNMFNLMTMLQIILASLLDYCLMGIVFARFAAPLPKSQAIRFSSSAVLYQPDGQSCWQLCFRMASIRKHSLLKPEISLLMALPEGAQDPSNAALKFVDLEVEDVTSQVANLRLGLPVIVVHVISPSSPLFDLSLNTMDSRGLEIICFLDGMDPMTSNSVQARHSYRPADMRMDEKFSPIGLQANWRGEMGLDFTQFDTTVSLEPQAPGSLELMHTNSGRLVGYTMPSSSQQDDNYYGGGSGRAYQLRSKAFRSLSAVPEQARADAAVSNSHSQEQVATGSKGGAGADPLGGLRSGQARSPGQPGGNTGMADVQVAALIEAVMADPGLGADLKRSAALARAELMASQLQSSSSAWEPLQKPSQQQQQQQQQQQGLDLYSAPWEQQLQLPVSASASDARTGDMLGMHGTLPPPSRFTLE